jgi:hypothetical protein
MPRTELRIYHGPDDEPEGDADTVSNAPESVWDNGVEVMLCDVATVLADAIQAGRSWLKDFADDRIIISRDLHEILQEYQRMRRGVA